MVQLLTSTDRGVHTENAVRWSFSALLALELWEAGGRGGRGAVVARGLTRDQDVDDLLSSSKVGSVSGSSMVGRNSTASRAEGDTMFSLE